MASKLYLDKYDIDPYGKKTKLVMKHHTKPILHQNKEPTSSTAQLAIVEMKIGSWEE